MRTHHKACITILLLCFILISCNSGKKDPEKINIGVIIPLTGDWSDYGVQMKRGIDLWLKENPKSKIDVLFEDGKALPKESVSAFSVLRNKDISAVIAGFSGVVLALAPEAEANKIPLINGGATNPEIKKSGKYVFSVIPDAEIEAKFIANFLMDSLAISECAIYWQNNDAGIGMRDNFTKYYTERNGKIRDCLSHNLDQKDFRNDLMKIKKSKVKTIFIPTYSKDLGLIIKQAYDLGLRNVLWVGYAAAETNDAIAIAGSRLNGKFIYSSYEFGNIQKPGNEKSERFIKSFKTEYNSEPGLYSATFYDAISIIHDALSHKMTVDEYIYSVDVYQGVLGTLKFNHKNYISSGMRMKMVLDQKFVEFQNDKLSLKTD